MYNKHFYEKYALLSLIECFSNDLEVLLQDKCEYENPDYQSEMLSLGIEVVEAITSKQGEERFIINEFFGKGINARVLKKDAEERFKKIRGKIKVIDDLAFYSHQPNGFRMSSRISLIQSKINEKLIKLNSHYKVFENNWLYVFAHISTVYKEEIESLDIHPLNEGDFYFDKVFVNCIDKIYVLTKEGTNVITISTDVLKKIKSESKNSVILHKE